MTTPFEISEMNISIYTYTHFLPVPSSPFLVFGKQSSSSSIAKTHVKETNNIFYLLYFSDFYQGGYLDDFIKLVCYQKISTMRKFA